MKKNPLCFVIKIFSTLMTLAFIVVLIINEYVYWRQDKMIYETTKVKFENPVQIPSNFENVIFTSSEGNKYTCWYVKTENSEEKPALLYIIGNGSYKELFIETYKSFSKKLDINILGCSMRGSGDFKGTPSEKALYEDAQTQLNYLKNKNIKHIFVHGRSMGGATAIETAYKNADVVTGLIVENTFRSMKAIAKTTHPFLYFILFNYDLIVKTKMDNEMKIKFIMLPTLFAVGLRDPVIAPEHTQTLYQMSPSPLKYLYQSTHGTHANVMKADEEVFFKTYSNFIQKAIEAKENKNVPE